MSHTSIDSFQSAAKKLLDFLHQELGTLQIGQASATLVENISIDAYGSSQPLKNLASISVDGGQSLIISPWDKSVLGTIEKAIREEPGLGLSPINDGNIVRLNIPPLTTERRKELTKLISKMGEDAKVTIRKHRHTAIEAIKKDEISEDEQKLAENQLQDAVTDTNKSIDSSVKSKQEDIMKI